MEWVKECYSDIKNEIMPSVAMLDLKIIILSEVRQTKTNIMILLICGPLGWLSGKEATCQCRRRSSISGSGKSPGEGIGSPLQYSCLGNPMDRGAWWATFHGVKRVQHNSATKQQQKIIQMSLFTKQNETHRHRKQTYGNQRWKEEGGTN